MSKIFKVEIVVRGKFMPVTICVEANNKAEAIAKVRELWPDMVSVFAVWRKTG